MIDNSIEERLTSPSLALSGLEPLTEEQFEDLRRFNSAVVELETSLTFRQSGEAERVATVITVLAGFSFMGIAAVFTAPFVVCLMALVLGSVAAGVPVWHNVRSGRQRIAENEVAVAEAKRELAAMLARFGVARLEDLPRARVSASDPS